MSNDERKIGVSGSMKDIEVCMNLMYPNMSWFFRPPFFKLYLTLALEMILIWWLYFTAAACCSAAAGEGKRSSNMWRFIITLILCAVIIAYKFTEACGPKLC